MLYKEDQTMTCRNKIKKEKKHDHGNGVDLWREGEGGRGEV